MTTSVETKPLYERLKDEGVNNEVSQTLVNMTVASLSLKDERTALDLHVALNNVLGAFGVPAFPHEEEFWAAQQTTAGEQSNVPLYQRLDEEPSVGSVVRNGLWNLLGYTFGISDSDTANEYGAALEAFQLALGLPTHDALNASPESFPNVTDIHV